MSKINGTSMLMYSNGTLIAAQKGCTVTWEVDLPDATNKDSGGWAEHINGQRSASVSFDGLFSTTGLNNTELIGYITSRASILLVIDGGGFPIVGEADLSSYSLNPGKEDTTGISGNFTFKGGAFLLTGAHVALFTDFDNVDYDTFTEASTVISSAVNAGGGASALSDTINVTDGDVIKVFTFLTLTSGQVPTISIWDNTSADISNAEALAAGANFKTLTVTSSDSSASLKIANTDASEFSTSAVYCFKV